MQKLHLMEKEGGGSACKVHLFKNALVVRVYHHLGKILNLVKSHFENSKKKGRRVFKVLVLTEVQKEEKLTLFISNVCMWCSVGQAFNFCRGITYYIQI